VALALPANRLRTPGVAIMISSATVRPILSDALEEHLRDDRAQAVGQGRADQALLLGRKRTSITRSTSWRRWRCCRVEKTSGRWWPPRRERDRFEIAHFADQNDVRVSRSAPLKGREKLLV